MNVSVVPMAHAANQGPAGPWELEGKGVDGPPDFVSCRGGGGQMSLMNISVVPMAHTANQGRGNCRAKGSMALHILADAFILLWVSIIVKK